MSRPGGRYVDVASFVGGFSVMGAEVAAGRLLAPYFGTSTLVWSALIGTVLGGLALGAWLGGRRSGREGALGAAATALAVAGLALAVAPELARPAMRSTLQSFLAGKLVVVALGLAGALVTVAGPIVVLGAVPPLLVHAATEGRREVGRVAGRLGALGTLGSLVGTFVGGVVLVPLAGTSAAFAVFGLVAAVTGTAGALRLRGARAALRLAGAALLALVAALAGPLGLVPDARAATGEHVVVERETPYNHLRVVDGPLERTLYLNEGFAAQTIAPHDGSTHLRGVWAYYALAPTFTMAPPRRVLVVGLGGGASATDYARRLPDAEIVALELDPGIVRVAREQFGLPASVEVHVGDARAILARETRTFDLVVVDAFQFPYVPFQLATRELYELLRDRTSAGGAVVVNVGRKGRHLDVVHALASTLGAVFPEVTGTLVPGTTNAILVATRHPLSRRGGFANARYDAAERKSLDALPLPETWQVPPEHQLVLTDDRAPVEWLTHRVILRELASMVRGREAGRS